MSFIKIIRESEATGELKEVYESSVGAPAARR
jgi:hypothetical protein